MEVTDIIAKYDDISIKNISLKEIGFEVCARDLTCSTTNSKFERLAFMLIPYESENPWEGYYYGPFSSHPNAEGEILTNPAFEEITLDSILYFENRYRNANNPILKMHYAGLVWDIKQRKFSQKYESDLYATYVSCMLQVCNEGYCKYPIDTVTILERLFEIAKGNETYLPSIKQAFKEFEKKYATDDSVRFWSSQFQLMTQFSKLYSNKEQSELLKEHEDRLSRLCAGTQGEPINLYFIQVETNLLSEYFNHKEQKEDIIRVQKKLESAIESQKTKISVLQQTTIINSITQLYQKYGISEEAKRLEKELQTLYKSIPAEMEQSKIEFEIPQEVYNQADIYFGDKATSDEERWLNFARYFLVDKTTEEEEMKKMFQNHPLSTMYNTMLYDPKGRPMIEIGTPDSDPEHCLALYVAQKMNIQQYFLNISINRLITSGALTVDKFMALLIEPSVLFAKDRYEIIRTAIDYFMRGDYVIFSHLIVPQLENAICVLAEVNNELVIKPQRDSKGFKLKTLDELLRLPSVEKSLTENGAYYMRLVLSNQCALNIRNLLCHGILAPTFFGSQSAGRLLHVVVLLALIR